MGWFLLHLLLLHDVNIYRQAMKEALVIGVLALAVLATPYPYHPSKLNGDLKNIQSNQDLNRRSEAYQLEPAPIREYTAQLRMQGKKPGKVISNDTEQDSTKSKFKNITYTKYTVRMLLLL